MRAGSDSVASVAVRLGAGPGDGATRLNQSEMARSGPRGGLSVGFSAMDERSYTTCSRAGVLGRCSRSSGRGLLLVVLDDVGRSDLRAVRVFTELTQRPS